MSPGIFALVTPCDWMLQMLIDIHASWYPPTPTLCTLSPKNSQMKLQSIKRQSILTKDY